MSEVGAFYVVAHEPGAEHPALPTWANDSSNPAGLAAGSCSGVRRLELVEVPGAFQLLNVVSPAECRSLIELSEALGYLPDAAVSLPRAIRHNDNVTWVADETSTDILWRRCARAMSENLQCFGNKRPLGLNARCRFYRYRPGDYFKPHTDGAWPGSKVMNRKLINNAYPDRYSQLSFVLFLSDEYTGGSTEFYSSGRPQDRGADSDAVETVVKIRTPAGAALCFPHGTHPLNLLHSSEQIVSGTKYIIRSDVLFEI